MQILKDKLAYLREHEDFSIVYTRRAPRDSKGRIMVGGGFTQDEQGRPVIFSSQLGTYHLHTTWEHQYKLGPCMTEAEIQSIEVRFAITLPDEYRNFLLEVGNGGAGPSYGLYAFEELRIMTLDECRGFNPDREGSAFLEPQCSAFIALTDAGGPYKDILIVDGPERGHIWLLDFGDYDAWEMYPIDKQYDTRRPPEGHIPQTVTFYEWYNLWLDQQIAELHERIYAIG